MDQLGLASRTPRYESLDVWRGVACLLVLVNHAVFYSLPLSSSPGSAERLNAMISAVAQRCWAGVPVFFVISGYCIAATIDGHRRRGTPVGTYFLKRFRRIFPPYWAVLFGMALVVGIGDVAFGGRLTAGTGLLRPWWYSPAQWIGSATLTEIWRYHLIGGQKGLFLGHAWTLCYEEQFYAVTGALLFLCPRRFFLGASLVTAAVVVVALLAHVTPLPVDGFFFDGGWIQFAMGILLFYALNSGAAKARRAAGVTFALVVVVATVFGGRLLVAVDKNEAQSFFVAGAFALLALVLHRFDRQALAVPALRPLHACGLMCYSLYLVHLPVTNLIRVAMQNAGVEVAALSPFISLPVCGVPAIWLAWRFHLAVERRFMSPSAPAIVRESVVTALA